MQGKAIHITGTSGPSRHFFRLEIIFSFFMLTFLLHMALLLFVPPFVGCSSFTGPMEVNFDTCLLSCKMRVFDQLVP